MRGGKIMSPHPSMSNYQSRAFCTGGLLGECGYVDRYGNRAKRKLMHMYCMHM